MCFSLSASLSAAFLLTTIGTISLYQFRKKSHLILLALMPLLFGIQQFFESLVWISLKYPSFFVVHPLGVYGFLLWAFVMWPLYVPSALFVAETLKKRKRILLFFIMLGAFISAFLLFRLFFYGASASLNHRINYHTNLALSEHYIWFFLFVTVIPFFISSQPLLWLLGFLLFLSFGMTYFLWYTHTISVWCFFAALLSGIVMLVLQFLPNRH